MPLNGLDHLPNEHRLNLAGGASAQEQSIYRPRQMRPRFNFAADRLGIWAVVLLVANDRSKGAVRATLGAKRHVDIETQRHYLFFRIRSRRSGEYAACS